MTSLQHIASWTADGSATVELAHLDGPVGGKIEAPAHLVAGETPGALWDLDDHHTKIRLYEVCLASGGPYDIYRWVNLYELVRLWAHLELPDHVANTWVRALHEAGLRMGSDSGRRHKLPHPRRNSGARTATD